MKKAFLGFIFLLVGLGCLYGSWYMYDESNLYLETAQRTPGEVIELKYKNSSDSSGGTYAPIFKFTVAETGQEVTIESNVSSNPPSFEVGEKVEVLYMPDAPHDARINSWTSLWLGSTITLVLGIVFLPLGMFTMAGGRNRTL